MNLGRSIAAHTILALGGLTWAYLVWTDDGPDHSEGEVTIVSCDPNTLTQVELRAEDRDVTLDMEDEHGERTAWLTVVHRQEEGDPTTTRFVGSQSVGEWLEQVAPLRAKRSLGELSEAQLGETGLDHPEARLTLHCGGHETVLALGGRAYGSGDRYVRAESGGPAYLVASDRISPLESAEFRFMERRLHTFEGRDIVSLTLRAFGQEKRLLQHNRLDEQRSEWVDAAAPDRRDDTYGNWLSRFPRLRVQRYLDPDARPGADMEGMSVTPAQVLRMDYQGESGPLGFLELTRVEGEEEGYYARTETTRSWVRVPASVAAQIEDDLRSMLGVDPLEHPSAQPQSARAGASEDAAQPGATEGQPGGQPAGASEGQPGGQPAGASTGAPSPGSPAAPATGPSATPGAERGSSATPDHAGSSAPSGTPPAPVGVEAAPAPH